MASWPSWAFMRNKTLEASPTHAFESSSEPSPDEPGHKPRQRSSFPTSSNSDALAEVLPKDSRAHRREQGLSARDLEIARKLFDVLGAEEKHRDPLKRTEAAYKLGDLATHAIAHGKGSPIFSSALVALRELRRSPIRHQATPHRQKLWVCLVGFVEETFDRLEAKNTWSQGTDLALAHYQALAHEQLLKEDRPVMNLGKRLGGLRRRARTLAQRRPLGIPFGA
jgi:hypothetical protein